MQKIMLGGCLLLLFVVVPVNAQDDAPPYLFYYSRMLGGLIIERADGTDSRLIGRDAILPGTTGISGPGWSPSGRYFATYNITYSLGGGGSDNPVIIDAYEDSVVSRFPWIANVWRMEWATDADVLLVINDDIHTTETTLWLVDAETGAVLADFATNLEDPSYCLGDVIWDVPNERIVFYIKRNFFTFDKRYRVTMWFDGTTRREPVTDDMLDPQYDSRILDGNTLDNNDDLYQGHKQSPSGDYEADGIYPTVLTNTRTDEAIELPVHTQGTICRDYLWNDDEDYIITLNGTLRAGGGCSPPVMGITNNQGELWRELGGCSWDRSTCFGWLPERVDVASLPPGSTEPVQLDPVRIDYEDLYPHIPESPPLTTRFRCTEPSMATIVDIETKQTLYTLANVDCPYSPGSGYADEGLRVVIAYDPIHDLLVMYHGGYVSVWTEHDGMYARVLSLNTFGYALEFTDDGKYLRTGNVHGWKVYAVEDILSRLETEIPHE